MEANVQQKLVAEVAKAADLVRNGDLDNAIIALKAVLEQQPDQELATGMLAAIYLQIGLTDKAIELFETLLSNSPENPLARFQLGMARLSQGEQEAALETWQPLLAQENEFMAHFHSALALVELKRYQEALDFITHANQHMPTSHPLYPQLLDLHSQLTSHLEK